MPTQRKFASIGITVVILVLTGIVWLPYWMNWKVIESIVVSLEPRNGSLHNNEAFSQLRQHGTNALPMLLKRLSYKDNFLHKACRKFDWYGEAFPYGRELELRCSAVVGFRALGSAAEPAITEIGTLLADPEITTYAGESLAAIGGEALPVLEAGLTNTNPIVRRGAIAGFRVSPKEVAQLHAAQIVSEATQGELELRLVAVRALGDIVPPAEAIPALIKLLSDSEEKVRARACDSLGKIGTPAIETISALQIATRDSSFHVRMNAEMAIDRINKNKHPNKF